MCAVFFRRLFKNLFMKKRCSVTLPTYTHGLLKSWHPLLYLSSAQGQSFPNTVPAPSDTEWSHLLFCFPACALQVLWLEEESFGGAREKRPSAGPATGSCVFSKASSLPETLASKQSMEESLGAGHFLNLEKGNAAALAHAGDVVECCARPHCSTLNLPPADMGSISSLSLLAVVWWWQPVPVPERDQRDQELAEQIEAHLQVLSGTGLWQN